MGTWRKNDPTRKRKIRTCRDAWIWKAATRTKESIDDSLDAQFGPSQRPPDYRRISWGKGH